MQERKDKNHKKDSTKIMKIVKETPEYLENTIKITSNKTINNPKKIQKTSNFISTSSDQKKINETIEETTGAIEEKSYEFTTIKPKKADLKDKRKQLTTIIANKENNYIIPNKNIYSDSSEKKSSGKKKYSTHTERINNSSPGNESNSSYNRINNYQRNYPASPFNYNTYNQEYDYNNQYNSNQSLNSHSHKNSNQFIYNDQTYNTDNPYNTYNIRTYNQYSIKSPNERNLHLYNQYEINTQRSMKYSIPMKTIDNDFFFDQIKKKGLLDIKDSQTYEIQKETSYYKKESNFGKKNRSVGQVIVNSRSKENLKNKGNNKKSKSQNEKYSIINETYINKRKGKISNLFNIFKKNNDNDKIITKGMRNEKGGVVDFVYGNLNKNQNYTFVKFKNHIQYSEKKKRESAKIIQKWWRNLLLIFHKYERLIIIIQSFIRGFLIRRFYKRILNKIKKILKERELMRKNKKLEKYREVNEENLNYNYVFENTPKNIIRNKKDNVPIEEEDHDIEDYLYVRNLATLLIFRIIQKKIINKYFDFLLSLKENKFENNESIIENYINTILRKILNKKEFNVSEILRNKMNKWRNFNVQINLKEKEEKNNTILKAKAKAIKDMEEEKTKFYEEQEKILKEKENEKNNLILEKENLLKKFDELIKEKDKEREKLKKEKEKLLKENNMKSKEKDTELKKKDKEKEELIKKYEKILNDKEKEKELKKI